MTQSVSAAIPEFAITKSGVLKKRSTTSWGRLFTERLMGRQALTSETLKTLSMERFNTLRGSLSKLEESDTTQILEHLYSMPSQRKERIELKVLAILLKAFPSTSQNTLSQETPPSNPLNAAMTSFLVHRQEMPSNLKQLLATQLAEQVLNQPEAARKSLSETNLQTIMRLAADPEEKVITSDMRYEETKIISNTQDQNGQQVSEESTIYHKKGEEDPTKYPTYLLTRRQVGNPPTTHMTFSAQRIAPPQANQKPIDSSLEIFSQGMEKSLADLVTKQTITDRLECDVARALTQNDFLVTIRQEGKKNIILKDFFTNPQNLTTFLLKIGIEEQDAQEFAKADTKQKLETKLKELFKNLQEKKDPCLNYFKTFDVNVIQPILSYQATITRTDPVPSECAVFPYQEEISRYSTTITLNKGNQISKIENQHQHQEFLSLGEQPKSDGTPPGMRFAWSNTITHTMDMKEKKMSLQTSGCEVSVTKADITYNHTIDLKQIVQIPYAVQHIKTQLENNLKYDSTKTLE